MRPFEACKTIAVSEINIRLGADIGGTFTDVVLECADVQFSTKVLTTYTAPEEAIVQGLLQVCSEAGIAPGQIQQIIHGTTLATNALIERRGARTALVTTQGFRDVIEMRTESRFEQYDLNLTLPEPLIARNRRYVVAERVDARGDVLVPLVRADVEALADELQVAGYESVAVGLLHSYANDTHERMVKAVLAERLPDVSVSLSSEVSPQMREYERFNTTIANAFIKPLMKNYLGRLESRLGSEGVTCPVYLLHSGGGIISLESAAEFPVRLVESGPAGGAVFAADIAARHGLEKVLSFDMGGTTAKICLIKGRTPKTSRVFEVARTYRFKKGSGMPISIPVIDMVEIGAGGGSLAHVDALRQVRVGPESAGSEPGPACYGQGGEAPAVTDADLMLGKLDADDFAGGSITLEPQASTRALGAAVGSVLDTDTTESAYAVSEVVDENMANAARVHAVENGEDLSEYTMIAFGGAAPLHAARLCEKLGVDRCLVPTGAAVGSAIGFLRAPFSFESNRTVFMRLADFDSARVRELFAEMEAEATNFVRTCAPDSPVQAEFKIYMRYSGQGWEVPVQLSAADAGAADPSTFLARFEHVYQDLFGRSVEGLDVEITVWSVNVTTPLAPVTPVAAATTTSVATSIGKRQVFDAGPGVFAEASVYSRDDLMPGASLSGPAVITETGTTIILPASRRALALTDGSVDVRRQES